LYIKATGDIYIDDHHLVEDIGLVLGQAFLKAIKNKKGITRYGQILSPMDESLSYIVVDISGRPYLDFKIKFLPEYKKSSFDYRLIKEFFKSFVNEAKITLYIKLLQGEDNHHICESIFKGVGRVLKIATELNKNKNLLSTKGVI
jgi:imidazoleglycerol-phosphate dehydratase